MTQIQEPPSFLAELKRRKVVRVGIAYGAAVFVVCHLGRPDLHAEHLGDDVIGSTRSRVRAANDCDKEYGSRCAARHCVE